MKKLKNRIWKGTSPIFFEGTLEDKYSELLEVQDRINALKENSDVRPSVKLFDERGEIETEIGRHLTNGEVLEDSFMDYCLSHFHGGWISSVSKGRLPSAFDRVDNVRKFMEYIPGAAREKIFNTYYDIPEETGIIDGNPFFGVEGCHRYLRVPVEQLFCAGGKKWSKGRRQWNSKGGKSEIIHGNFTVPTAIFSHPGKTGENGIWSSNMAGIEYFGIPGNPGDTYVYVGDKNVDEAISLGRMKEFPKDEKELYLHQI